MRPSVSPGMLFSRPMKWVYDGSAAFDETFDRDGDARAHYQGIVGVLESFTQGEVSRRERLQKLALMDQGITFTVYGEKEGLERIFPFDFVPRIVTAREWERLEAGLVQRVTALNLFIADVYGAQKCHKDRVVPPALLHAAPRAAEKPVAVVLSPGIHNSAFFEHSFLAREMGTTLVEGRDLVVEDNQLFMRTTRGRQRVDVVYRRIDEDFLDPLVFRRDSLLGVPGLLNAYRQGNVAIANAPGAGVADDKSVYAFMPELIKYYLGEDARLGQVPTYVGFRREDFAFMREHAAELVIKTTGDSGGYNMLMGPFATGREIG